MIEKKTGYTESSMKKSIVVGIKLTFGLRVAWFSRDTF